jgi:transposase
VLRHRFNWKRLSLAAAVAYAADHRHARVVFQTRAGAYNDEALIAFLGAVHDELGGAKVTLIWDGLPSHRSRRMLAWVRAQRRWLVVERLPAYAPDLNPVEGLWGNVKGTELANLCLDTIEETAHAAETAIDRIRADTGLAFAFLAHTGLPLRPLLCHSNMRTSLSSAGEDRGEDQGVHEAVAARRRARIIPIRPKSTCNSSPGSPSMTRTVDPWPRRRPRTSAISRCTVHHGTLIPRRHTSSEIFTPVRSSAAHATMSS